MSNIKKRTAASRGTARTDNSETGKENIPPPLSSHLNERGREYELMRREERRKHAERIQKLAASKAARERQLTNKQTARNSSAGLYMSDPNDDDAFMAEDHVDAVPRRRSRIHLQLDVESDQEEQSTEDEEEPEQEQKEQEEEDESLQEGLNILPEKYTISGIRKPPLKTHRPYRIFGSHVTSPGVPSVQVVPSNLRYAFSSPGVVTTSSASQTLTNTLKRKTADISTTSSEDTPSLVTLHGTDRSAHAPSEVESEGTEPCTKQRRIRMRDFVGFDRTVLRLAIEEFQVRVCTKYAFPEATEDKMDEWVGECWENACGHQECSLELTPAFEKLIRKRTSTIRGRIKDNTTSRVPSLYGFRDTTTDDDIEYNKQHGVKLLKDLSFIYKDAEKSRGMYEHPILQAVINAQFFSRKLKSTGVTFSAAFNPIPDETIALVFTAVQFVITRWANQGMAETSGLFTEEEWHGAYKMHLEGVKRWTEYNEQTAKAMARHKQKLFDFGSKIAGVKQESDPGKMFSDDVLARAAAALET